MKNKILLLVIYTLKTSLAPIMLKDGEENKKCNLRLSNLCITVSL